MLLLRSDHKELTTQWLHVCSYVLGGGTEDAAQSACGCQQGLCSYQVGEVEELLITTVAWLRRCKVCGVQALAVWLSAASQRYHLLVCSDR
jgi:hypothetical protein